MNLSAVNIPLQYFIPLLVLFWIAVFLQETGKKREANRIAEETHCSQCGSKDLAIRVHQINARNKNSISLLKNIWGASMFSVIGIPLLISFVLIITDLVTGTDISGIQSDTLRMKIAMVSVTLILGLLCVVISILLLKGYFIGGKEKIVEIECNNCKHVVTEGNFRLNKESE